MKNIAPMNMNKMKNTQVAHWFLKEDGPYCALLALKQICMVSPHPSKEAATNNVSRPLATLSKLQGQTIQSPCYYWHSAIPTLKFMESLQYPILFPKRCIPNISNIRKTNNITPITLSIYTKLRLIALLIPYTLSNILIIINGLKYMRYRDRSRKGEELTKFR